MREYQDFSMIDESVQAELSEAVLKELCAQLQSANEEENEELVRIGRARVQRSILSSGKVLIGRAYRRGGLPAAFVRQWFWHLPFLGSAATRPVKEFLLLGRLRESGLSVPLAVAVRVEFAFSGFFYRGFLFTEEVSSAENLLHLGVSAARRRDREARFLQGCYLAGLEAKKMLRAGVLHRDLHPGNVLLTADNRVVLLDFDKAREYPNAQSRVGDPGRLVMRWERSVEKHQLTYGACTEFSRGLFEGRREE